MTFDFTLPEEVRVTMDNLISVILSECGVPRQQLPLFPTCAMRDRLLPHLCNQASIRSGEASEARVPDGGSVPFHESSFL